MYHSNCKTAELSLMAFILMSEKCYYFLIAFASSNSWLWQFSLYFVTFKIHFLLLLLVFSVPEGCLFNSDVLFQGNYSANNFYRLSIWVSNNACIFLLNKFTKFCCIPLLPCLRSRFEALRNRFEALCDGYESCTILYLFLDCRRLRPCWSRASRGNSA